MEAVEVGVVIVVVGVGTEAEGVVIVAAEAALGSTGTATLSGATIGAGVDLEEAVEAIGAEIALVGAVATLTTTGVSGSRLGEIGAAVVGLTGRMTLIREAVLGISRSQRTRKLSLMSRGSYCKSHV